MGVASLLFSLTLLAAHCYSSSIDLPYSFSLLWMIYRIPVLECVDLTLELVCIFQIAIISLRSIRFLSTSLLLSQVRRPQAWSRVRQLEIPTGSPFQTPFGGGGINQQPQRPIQQLGHWVYDPFEARWVWSRMQKKRHERHLHKRVRRF